MRVPRAGPVLQRHQLYRLLVYPSRYQPDPFKTKPVEAICRSGVPSHDGSSHRVTGGSVIFCSTSNSVEHFWHRYGYVGMGVFSDSLVRC